MWSYLKNGDWDALQAAAPNLTALSEFLAANFGVRGFTDTAYDRMGGRASGFLTTSLQQPRAVRVGVAGRRGASAALVRRALPRHAAAVGEIS
jgi:hypothetical protein